MAKNVVVIGTQWGDEGKGKIVDWLTDEVAGVVRFQGGHNAGHTLVVNGKENHFAFDPVWHAASARHVFYWQWCGVVARRVAAGNR